MTVRMSHKVNRRHPGHAGHDSPAHVYRGPTRGKRIQPGTIRGGDSDGVVQDTRSGYSSPRASSKEGGGSARRDDPHTRGIMDGGGPAVVAAHSRGSPRRDEAARIGGVVLPEVRGGKARLGVVRVSDEAFFHQRFGINGLEAQLVQIATEIEQQHTPMHVHASKPLSAYMVSRGRVAHGILDCLLKALLTRCN